MKHDVYDQGAATAAPAGSSGREKTGSPKPDADKAELMKKMEAAGAPGPAHKALGALTGNWKAKVKCWMEPGGPPNVSQGTSKTSWIMGGRFLEEDFHGETMGKPFNGRCLMGFDNAKQKFNCVWFDDVHTSMFTSEGKGDDGFKVITLEGKADCLMTGRKDMAVKQVVRVVSPDKHVLEMFNDGAKSMEITYTRQ
jgi:hypothetical protein